MTRTVGIYIFDGVEVLDLAGPFEVFTSAVRAQARADPQAPAPFTVFTVADRVRAVRAGGDLIVTPHHALGQHPPVDILVVPGGEVAAEIERPEIIRWVAETARSAAITASVCSGAFFLAAAGLLQGKDATTH